MSHPVGQLALSAVEAASVLGLSRTMVYRLISDGRLRSVRVGGRVLVPLDAVHDFLRLPQTN